MTVKRRQFLKTSAGITIGGLASSMTPFTLLFSQNKDRGSVAVLWENGFGRSEILGVTRELLERSLKGFDLKFLSAADLPSQLTRNSFDLLIMPFGSHFPMDSFPAILRFLRSGGNLLNIGGTPFSIPWIRSDSKYSEGVRQVNYHKEIGITQSFFTLLPKKYSLVPHPTNAISSELKNVIQYTSVHELYYRLADTNDFPNESGTTGTQDAVVTPLLWITDESEEKRAAPVIQIDHIRGAYTGSRWILVNAEGTIKPEAITLLAQQAISGTVQLSAAPGYACYRNGEQPSVTVRLRYPGGNCASIVRGPCVIELRDAKNKLVAVQQASLGGNGGLITVTTEFDRKKTSSLAPGLYRIEVTQKIQTELSAESSLSYQTGFWIYDEALMKSGKEFTVDGDYFLKDGKPYPVCGTTYMTSDIHRKFLFEPNPWVWHEDFLKMKETGMNMVRTGIWTAWRNYMLDPGVLNETTMRSLDAFLMTARSFDIPVIFTFFAFLPELWNGENAYLDPRSVNAQKEFVALIVRRYTAMNDVMWDLINEPSFCSPNNLWSCRPNYDQYEQTAWTEWLQLRYPSRSTDEYESLLRQYYRLRPDESLGLPVMSDFIGTAIHYDKRPLKTVDYKYFAQAMFASWSNAMVQTIRTNGNPKQLITVGQDEAGTGDSPSPHFFAHTIDFTSLHNWWLNDDLVWDSVMTKVHGKANLIEETGVMFYEKPDGSAYRTEFDAAQLLDRKIAISLGTGGAGFIQWIWNINPLMKNDNEATIGLLRVDGTVKPEYDVVKKYSSFISKHHHLFAGRMAEEVVLLIPHSQIFTPRNSATEATKRSVRTLTYHLGIPVRSAAEHADSSVLKGAKLIIVPSPRTLSDRGWNVIQSAANAGATVMISGIIDDNEFYIRKNRSESLSQKATLSVIAQEEILHINGVPHRFSFRGEKMQQLEKADLSPGQEQELVVIPFGKGTIIWSPIPVENSESVDQLQSYYSFGLNHAGIKPIFTARKKDPSLLVLPQQFTRHTMYTLVSESSEDFTLSFTHGSTAPVHTVTVPAQQAMILFLDTTTGELIGRTE